MSILKILRNTITVEDIYVFDISHEIISDINDTVLPELEE